MKPRFEIRDSRFVTRIILSCICCLATVSFAADQLPNGLAGGAGLPVDRSGGPTVDPTMAVRELVIAAVKRLDDLRDAESKHFTEFTKLANLRSDDLRAAESRRVDEELKMRAEFEDRLAAAEKARIDAIRAVDVAAVATANERATQQAAMLAAQVTTSADTLRNLVSSSAQTLAEQQRNLTTQLNDRIAALEKAQYANQGQGEGRLGLWALIGGCIFLAVLLYNTFTSRQNGKILRTGRTG